MLCLVSCEWGPTQEEMNKTVKYDSDVKFCTESEGVDVLSLTDSEGINIREYYRPMSFKEVDGETEESIDIIKDTSLSGRTDGFDLQANWRSGWPTTGILGYETNNQIVRLYSDSKPFTGKAKLCVDSVEVHYKLSWGSDIYWIKKKPLVWEEMDVVDGWIDGEFIWYEYSLLDDKKTVSSSKEIKKFKKGTRINR